MNSTKTELEGFSYDSKGLIQYHLLYPLLTDYWNKPLAELPQALQLRVKYAVPGWDDIDNSEPCAIHHRQLTTRQKLVKFYDMHRDITQEYNTYSALTEYIQGAKLQAMIDKANENGMASVAVVLSDNVALPLKEIKSEVGIHWPNLEPLLWRSLYRFRENSLSVIRDKAKSDKDMHLVLALDEVSLCINKILNIQRYRMDDETKSAKIADAVKCEAPVATGELAGEKPWNVINPNDPLAEQPWYIPARYFARELVNDDSTLLTKRNLLSEKISQSLYTIGIKKRGGKYKLAPGTILKALSNISLG